MYANQTLAALLTFLALTTSSLPAQSNSGQTDAANSASQPQQQTEEAPARVLTTRPPTTGRWRSADELDTPTATTQPKQFEVPAGTRIPLGLINTISTRNADVGTRVYLETLFPIVVDSTVVIPAGSHVLGTVTSTKRPGRMKGKGEIHLRFDSILLPNGVSRDFTARVGGLDGGLREGLDKDEGVIKGDSNKGDDVQTVVGTTVSGGSIGALGGLAAGNPGRGSVIGLGAGAAAGLATVLLTRGPDVVLPAGSSLELVTDRPLIFQENELSREAAPRSVIRTNQAPNINQTSSPNFGRRTSPY
jgi:hypothetical protein